MDPFYWIGHVKALIYTLKRPIIKRTYISPYTDYCIWIEEVSVSHLHNVFKVGAGQNSRLI